MARFSENNSGKFDVIFQRHTRIRLLSRNAFDLATLEIPILTFGSFEQKMEYLQAVTYNIEDGKVIAMPVDKSAIIVEKNKKFKVTKLTLPNIKEGSIIEFAYSVRSPGNYLPEWSFQGSYPKLWSEYDITIPFFYNYNVYKRGTLNFSMDSIRSFHVDYDYYNNVPNKNNTTKRVWGIKDVPALKREPYTTTTDNYISKIEFHLAAYTRTDGNTFPVNEDWATVCNHLFADESFAYSLTLPLKWLNSEVNKAVGAAATPLDKVRNIFAYVRDEYTCTDRSARSLSQELKQTVQTKEGNVADINMLLTAMLLNIKVDAKPAILSTTDNGRAFPSMPFLSQYNYVVCFAYIDRNVYLLDASNRLLGFNKLDNECYNGYVQVIAPWYSANAINLVADSLQETEATAVFIMNAQNGKATATVTNHFSYQPSLQLKEDIRSEDSASFFEKVKADYPIDIDISNAAIENLRDPEKNIAIKYQFVTDLGHDSLIYFNPMLAGQEKENPFFAAKRFYPVEMPFCMNKTYTLNMEIPAGYTLDALPKSLTTKFNGNDGLFCYSIDEKDNHVQLNVILKLTKATYEPEDYQNLRDFFTMVVKKEAEQIVFKKKK
ncbi:DUF3858 domain-containing protein [Ilyomonas limi]|nr:DUF3857 domain-containing protein [Ilyomonas limi]